jgi:hypothetical protein
VLAAKFVEGAWITALLIPVMLSLMIYVRRHYHSVFLEMRTAAPLELGDLAPPFVIVPLQVWNHLAAKSLRFALKISPCVQALHVDCGEGAEILRDEWKRLVEEPARQADLPIPELVVLASPYRLILAPVVEYVLKLERDYPNQQIAVLIPELVERHFYHYFLHNKRASVLKALLLLKGNQRIVIINVPWYLKA